MDEEMLDEPGTKKEGKKQSLLTRALGLFVCFVALLFLLKDEIVKRVDEERVNSVCSYLFVDNIENTYKDGTCGLKWVQVPAFKKLYSRIKEIGASNMKEANFLNRIFWLGLILFLVKLSYFACYQLWWFVIILFWIFLIAENVMRAKQDLNRRHVWWAKRMRDAGILVLFLTLVIPVLPVALFNICSILFIAGFYQYWGYREPHHI